MTIKQGVVLGLAIVAIVSCSSGGKGEDAPEAGSAMTKITASKDSPSEKLSGVIPQHQLDALKKAKDVEGLLKKSDEEMRKKMESM